MIRKNVAVYAPQISTPNPQPLALGVGSMLRNSQGTTRNLLVLSRKRQNRATCPQPSGTAFARLLLAAETGPVADVVVRGRAACSRVES